MFFFTTIYIVFLNKLCKKICKRNTQIMPKNSSTVLFVASIFGIGEQQAIFTCFSQFSDRLCPLTVEEIMFK